MIIGTCAANYSTCSFSTVLYVRDFEGKYIFLKFRVSIDADSHLHMYNPSENSKKRQGDDERKNERPRPGNGVKSCKIESNVYGHAELLERWKQTVQDGGGLRCG